VDEAILAAALELLAEQGYSRLTVEGVALRAGVAKTSLYRRWSTKESLILDAVVNVGLAERPEVPDTGGLHEDMLSYLRAWVRFRRAQAWASEVLANAELKYLFRQKLAAGLTSGFRTIIERAVERGELPPHTDIALMATLPMALIHQHYALTGKPADERLARRIADQFFRAAGPSRQSRGKRS
jgi:AcrR family transcriptional regulator